MEFKLPWAENVSYWKTSKSDAGRWLDMTEAVIKKLGGTDISSMYGRDGRGKSAVMVGFTIGEDMFRIVWVPLPSRTHDERAAMVQACTLMYHDVKAKCLTAFVRGVRDAFLPYLLLTDGTPITMLSAPQLLELTPSRLLGSGG